MNRLFLYLMFIVAVASIISAAKLEISLPVKATKCDMCQNLFAALIPVIRANQTKQAIGLFAQAICEVFRIECSNPEACREVCNGVIHAHLDEVIEIVTTTVLAPPEICYRLHYCPKPPPPPQPSGIVPVPSNLTDLSGEKEWPSWRLTTGVGKILHISDIHIDPEYQAGTNTNCGRPLCCRAAYGTGTAGIWGDYKCDSPPALIHSLFHHIRDLPAEDQPDMIVYTGDDPPHDIWRQSKDGSIAAIDLLSSLMAQYFPHIPIFSAVGNHEMHPVNQFRGPGYDAWLYKVLAADWSHWLPNDALPTIQYGGYYAARARPGLRLVSLNTNVYSPDNFWLKQNNSDFSSQFPWLKDVLKQARTLGEKVVIMGHSPPGQWTTKFADAFHEIVEDNQDIIVAHFYGHAHASNIVVFRDRETLSTPISIGYVSGSVTPYLNLNPGYRMYSYNRHLRDRFLVQDIEQHWTNLTSANERTPYYEYLDAIDPTNGMMAKASIDDWSDVRYRAKEAYSLTNLTADNWQDMVFSMLINGPLFRVYRQHYYRGAIEYQTDKWITRTALVCDIISVTQEQYTLCYYDLLKAGVLESKEMEREMAKLEVQALLKGETQTLKRPATGCEDA